MWLLVSSGLQLHSIGVQIGKGNVEKSKYCIGALDIEFFKGCPLHAGTPTPHCGHMLLSVTCDVINKSTYLAGCHLLQSIHDLLSMNR